MRSGIINQYSVPGVQQQPEAWWSKQTPRQWVALAAKQPLLFAPGTKYNYSNTNWLIIGLIIEKVTHDSIESQISKRILVPMSLTATSFPTIDWKMPSPYAHGYTLEKDAWVDQSAVLAPSVSWAAGAMISDMPDMQRWVKAYVTGRHQWFGDAKRPAHVSADRRGQSLIRSWHRLFGRMVRIHGRDHRLQHRCVLHACHGHNGHRLREQSDREAVPGRAKCHIPRHCPDSNAEQRPVREVSSISGEVRPSSKTRESVLFPPRTVEVRLASR
jgi:CubicO group peptidase (beta-lactamase class C family)